MRAAGKGGKRILQPLDGVNLNSSQLAQSGEFSSENKDTQSWRGEEGGEEATAAEGLAWLSQPEGMCVFVFPGFSFALSVMAKAKRRDQS